MSGTILQSAFLAGFKCLGDACEDTCCKGWGMLVDAQTKERYAREAPELLDAVTSGEADIIMKRDEQTDYCVKFDKGWCGIHAKYGSDFLGDACHFFPRVTRGLGEQAVMTATLSCPETARLMLYGENPFGFEQAAVERLPNTLKNYLSDEMTAAEAMQTHQAFMAAALDENAAPERIMARLSSVARSMQLLDKKTWPQAAAFYLKNADTRLPAPEANAVDMFNLLHALSGLIAASRKSDRARLMQTIGTMEQALKVTLNWEKLSIALSPESPQALAALMQRYNSEWAVALAPVLRRWLAAQLSLAMFPFAGLGATLTERISIIGVRFATTRLALISACEKQQGVHPEEVVRTVQSLARFLDHLADPALSLQIFEETGWLRENRLRALIGDA